MYKLAFLFSMILALNVNALTTDTQFNSECTTGNIEECLLAKSLFSDNLNTYSELDIASLDVIDVIDVIEVEEEVVLGFDTSKYLPEGFNAFKGLGDLDWSKIEIIEIEEEVVLGFDTSKYLPDGFNAFKGMGDLDWNKIEIYEIEEEVVINFDTSKYLPESFNAFKGMDDLDLNKIEIVEEVDIYSNNKLHCSL